MKLRGKHLLGIDHLEPDEITLILNTADSLAEISRREIKKVPTLRGRTVVNFFVEPSTRTLSSFELAEKRLSADSLNFSASSSSFRKGETLLDTARNLEAMAPDFLVMRHNEAGAPHFLARHCSSSIINAGDGAHEHPTQALLDLLTIRERHKTLKGLKVVIVGDIAHSRVARSNILAMLKMGMKVTVVGPPTMIPVGMEQLGVSIQYNLEEALQDVDVVMMLRIQLERQNQGLFSSFREYSSLYCLTAEKLKKAGKQVMIMHPGPVNRGVEISLDILECPHSVVLDQVHNGVGFRMAVLYLVFEGGNDVSN